MSTTLGSTTMRALVFDAPARDASTSRIAELPVPPPGRGQLAIDVHYAGLNFKDIMARRGDRGYVPSWPFVPGLEVAGTVRELGEGVTGLRIGDRVTAFTGAGGLAEVALAEAALTLRVPTGMTLAQAAAAPGALVSAALLLDDFGRLRPGEAILVHGAAGGVGQAVAGLARLAGARLVLGTVGSPSRVTTAERIGFDAVFARGGDWAKAARHATDGRGVDLVLDPHGTDLLHSDLEAAAPGARIVLFGNASGAPLTALPTLTELMAANATITGFSLAALAATAPNRVTAALARVLDHLVNAELDLDTTVVGDLVDAAAAQQAIADGRVNGKQVVRIATSRTGACLAGWPATAQA